MFKLRSNLIWYKIIPYKLPSIWPLKLINKTNTNSKASKDQACKRVGSLKVDTKKVKSNVARSKR